MLGDEGQADLVRDEHEVVAVVGDGVDEGAHEVADRRLPGGSWSVPDGESVQVGGEPGAEAVDDRRPGDRVLRAIPAAVA